MSHGSTPLRVLYLDDDEMALTMTQLQLLRSGIQMEATSDALEAVGILASQDLDLILVDSVMPTIDGVEFLQLIRLLQLDHPVVFLTGYGVEELRTAVSEFEVLDILDKHQDRMNLPERLRDIHRAHIERGFSPQDSVFGPRAAS